MTIAFNFHISVENKIIFICGPLSPDLIHTAFKYCFCFIDKCDIIAKLFNGFHIVGRKNYCGSSFSQEKDLIFN